MTLLPSDLHKGFVRAGWLESPGLNARTDCSEYRKCFYHLTDALAIPAYAFLPNLVTQEQEAGLPFQR